MTFLLPSGIKWLIYFRENKNIYHHNLCLRHANLCHAFKVGYELSVDRSLMFLSTLIRIQPKNTKTGSQLFFLQYLNRCNGLKCRAKRRELVGNKAKERFSKRVFQESKACQIFRKTKISYHFLRTRMRAYHQRVRNFRFSENLTCFVFLKHPFWDWPFCLITDELLLQSSPP